MKLGQLVGSRLGRNELENNKGETQTELAKEVLVKPFSGILREPVKNDEMDIVAASAAKSL